VRLYLKFPKSRHGNAAERKLHEAQIYFQATHDPLTGLPNRTLLYDRLNLAVLKAHRYGNLVAIVFFDLDQFKYVNDSLGHQVGDQLPKMVAKRLKVEPERLLIDSGESNSPPRCLVQFSSIIPSAISGRFVLAADRFYRLIRRSGHVHGRISPLSPAPFSFLPATSAAALR
jgi:hypothetical protein